MNRTEALNTIDQAINTFQKFVLQTQEIYYKQDASLATEIGSKLHQMKHLIEKQKTEEVINEHRR